MSGPFSNILYLLFVHLSVMLQYKSKANCEESAILFLKLSCIRIFDNDLVMYCRLMKLLIEDASGLVCKRRKAPKTVIDIWRFYRIPALAKIFLEPLIPCKYLSIFVFYLVVGCAIVYAYS